MRCRWRVLAVASAIEPEALARLVLDLEIVAHRGQFGIALPPFAEHALGTVGALHAAAHAAPGEAGRADDRASSATVSIGSGGGNRRAGRGQWPARPRRIAARAARSAEPQRSGTSLADRAQSDRACRSPTRLASVSIRPETSASGSSSTEEISLLGRQRLGDEWPPGVMISMPKPGSTVSILSQSSRVRRLTSRTGCAVPTRTASMRIVDAVEQKIEAPRAEALRLQRLAKLRRRACRCSGRLFPARRSARQRRGEPRSVPAGGSARSARRAVPRPDRAGGRVRDRNAAPTAREASPRVRAMRSKPRTRRPSTMSVGRRKRRDRQGAESAVALSPGGMTIVGRAAEARQRMGGAPAPGERSARARCRRRQAARPFACSMASSPP